MNTSSRKNDVRFKNVTTGFQGLSALARLVAIWSLSLIAIGICGNGDAFGQCRVSPPKVDWTTKASRYTHDAGGNRVDQYASAVAPPSFERADYQRSGYRHYRSTIQVGNSADNYHVVDQWGGPVQPYEEWRFPFRPFSSPYDLWGPPPPAIGVLPYNPGLLGPFGPNFLGAPGGGFPNGIPNGFPNGVPGGFPGQGFPNNGNPGNPGPFNPNRNFQFNRPNPGTGQPPWIDGYWPQAPQEPALPDRQFFNVPRP